MGLADVDALLADTDALVAQVDADILPFARQAAARAERLRDAEVARLLVEAEAAAAEAAPALGRVRAVAAAIRRSRSEDHKRRRTRVALAAVTAVLLVWLGADRVRGEAPPEPPAYPTMAPAADPHVTTVATAPGGLDVYGEAGAGAPVRRLAAPGPGEPVVVRVVDGSQPEWLEVELPVRPHGTTGWVRRSAVRLSETRYHVRVLLADHRLEVYNGPELTFHAVVGIGADDTPTPGGRFFITDLARPPTPGTVYGDYVFGLSGYSDVVRDYNGGEGVIGIHGTNDPASVGSDVSKGCIRMTNDDIAHLARTLPLGTPVTIVA